MWSAYTGRPHGLDVATVTEFLQRELGGPVSDVAAIEGGQWSSAFSFVHDATERPLIARFGALDEDYRKDQRMLRYASDALRVPHGAPVIVDGDRGQLRAFPATATRSAVDRALARRAASTMINNSIKCSFVGGQVG